MTDAGVWACGFCRRTYTLDNICCQQQRDYRASHQQPAPSVESEYQFEVWQDDAMEASGSASTPEEAQREAGHYALMYGQDGPVEVRFYERRPFAQQPASGESHE